MTTGPAGAGSTDVDATGTGAADPAGTGATGALGDEGELMA
jgi:hypothetical protein